MLTARLIYVSQIDPSAAPTLADHMREILTSSSRWNEQYGVTGFLLSNGWWFVQAIEGSNAALDACMQRITRDARHFNVTVRTHLTSAARSFDRWSMCGMSLSGFENDLMKPPDIEFHPWSASSEALLQVLHGVAARHGAELDALHAEFTRDGAGAASSRLY
jgi:hypothetical protein